MLFSALLFISISKIRERSNKTIIKERKKEKQKGKHCEMKLGKKYRKKKWEKK